MLIRAPRPCCATTAADNRRPACCQPHAAAGPTPRSGSSASPSEPPATSTMAGAVPRHKEGREGPATGHAAADVSHHFRLFGASKVCCSGRCPAGVCTRAGCQILLLRSAAPTSATALARCPAPACPAACPLSPSHARRPLPASQLAIAVVASLAWMAVSSGLILLNKDLLSHGFHFPMALSGLGMAFSGTASYLCCRVRAGVAVRGAHCSLRRAKGCAVERLARPLRACPPPAVTAARPPAVPPGVQNCGRQKGDDAPLLRNKNPAGALLGCCCVLLHDPVCAGRRACMRERSGADASALPCAALVRRSACSWR